ncbi:MAG: MFS transporter [Spirochaetia bacterium]|jgi:MFS family permease
MDEPSPAARGRTGTFAALAYPNYRLWFFGQMTSLFGTWMQSTAQGYLVYELTRSEAYLGYVGFASGIAAWIFLLYGGAIADRVPRRSLLVITQSLSMILALVLAGLTFLHVVAPWHIIVLAFSLGVVNAFDAPSRQSFVLEMVDRRVLTNAIALNSTMFNMAMVVGPSVGGLAYAFFGPGWCFVINGLSFVAVIAALLAMKLAPWHPPERTGSTLAEIRAGLRAVASDRRILGVICLLGAVSLFGMSFVTLIPAWAVNILKGDARTNGFLQSARGIGALAAALGIATLSPRRSRGAVMMSAAFVLPILLILFSLTRSLPLSLAVLLTVGAANIVVNNLANSLVQSLTPDHLRGRVMGVYMLTFFGFAPVGALLAGGAATAVGVPLTVELGAAGTLACAAVLALAIPSLRRLE